METNYSKIIDRMKESADLKNDSAVAKELNVTPQALSNYKKRGKMPTNLIIKFATTYNVSVDWLITGQGGIISNTGSHLLREEPSPYRTEETENMAEVAALSPEEIIAVGKLLMVLRCSNKSTISALNYSLDAFIKGLEEDSGS